MWPNRLASAVHPYFVEASPTLEKTASCYKADRLVALSLPAVREFGVQERNAVNEATEGVCEPDIVAPKAHQNNTYICLS